MTFIFLSPAYYYNIIFILHFTKLAAYSKILLKKFFSLWVLESIQRMEIR